MTRAGAAGGCEHLDAAKAAAGTEFAGVYSRICTEATQPVPQAGGRGRWDRRAGRAGRTAACRSAAARVVARRAGRVFDNLYFLGQTNARSGRYERPAGIILIDSIFDYSVDDEVAGGLRTLGLDPASIKYVVVSHGHGDHSGGAKFLQDKFNAHVLLMEADWDLLDRGNGSKPRRDVVATDGQKLTLGDTTITLYNTPGHTLGTISTVFPVTDHGVRHVVASSGRHRVQLDEQRRGVFHAGAARGVLVPDVSQLRNALQRRHGEGGRRRADLESHDLRRLEEEHPGAGGAQPGDPNPYVIGQAGVQRC